MTAKSKAYYAWRESESYQVPMTEEGVALADRRLNAFTKGWNEALKHAIDVLMEEHYENDHLHNIYHVSAKIIERLKDG